MFKAIIIILTLSSTLSFGQTFQDSVKGNFVYLFDGQIIYNDHVLYVQPGFKPAYLEVGNTQIPPGKVKFYKNSEGFFANTIRYGSADFAHCKAMGEINYFKFSKKFSKTYYNVDFKSSPKFPLIDEYINKGFDNLELADLKTLERNLAENPQSMKHLKKFKIVRNVRNSMLAVGGAAIIGGLALFANTGNDSFASTGFVIGISFLLSQNVVFFALPKKVKAVRYYNEGFKTE